MIRRLQVLVLAPLIGVVLCGLAPRAEALDVVIVNLNLEPTHDTGSRRLRDRLEGLTPDVRVRIVHWRQVLAEPSLVVQTDAVVLSPQSTPWQEYPVMELDALAGVGGASRGRLWVSAAGTSSWRWPSERLWRRSVARLRAGPTTGCTASVDTSGSTSSPTTR